MGVLYAKVNGTWVPIMSESGTINWPDGFPTYDPRYVNVPGDKMTGQLVIHPDTNVAGLAVRRPDQLPSIAWQHTDGTRFGYIQVSGTEYNLYADGASPITFTVSPNGERFRIRSGASGEVATLYGGPSAFLYFRDSPPTGAVHCYVGGDATWGARLTAQARDALLQAVAGDIRVMSNGFIDVWTNGASQHRFMTNGTVCLNKTVDDPQVNGHYFNFNIQVSSNNQQNTPIAVFNKFGAGVGPDHDYLHFRTNNGPSIGSIHRNGSQSAVVYATTSDYRLKEDRGLITGARERIKVLKPRRVVWKDDPDQTEVDGFFAHEVAEVVPDAVTGEKDGENMQMMDNSRLIPLLVAAVQELSAKVETLEAEIAELKGAA